MDLIVDTSYEQLKVILSDNGISFCNQEKNGKYIYSVFSSVRLGSVGSCRQEGN